MENPNLFCAWWLGYLLSRIDHSQQIAQLSTATSRHFWAQQGDSFHREWSVLVPWNMIRKSHRIQMIQYTSTHHLGTIQLSGCHEYQRTLKRSHHWLGAKPPSEQCPADPCCLVLPFGCFKIVCLGRYCPETWNAHEPAIGILRGTNCITKFF